MHAYWHVQLSTIVSCDNISAILYTRRPALYNTIVWSILQLPGPNSGWRGPCPSCSYELKVRRCIHQGTCYMTFHEFRFSLTVRQVTVDTAGMTTRYLDLVCTYPCV
jgi:hypothetical protein